MKKIIAGNWKMNGSLEETTLLLTALIKGLSPLHEVDVIVCPPFLYLERASKMLMGTGIALGAQEVSAQIKGAYTGQISGAMLHDVHCEYVLVGHSERRQHCLENEQMVAEKFLAAVKSGLRPILCVGETLEERQSQQMEAVVRRQLEAVVAIGGSEVFAGSLVAYEPVWAIGTGLSATPEEVQHMHSFIRRELVGFHSKQIRPTPILYGGSVKSDNVDSLLKLPNVDGCLVGGASLVALEFLKICERANLL